MIGIASRTTLVLACLLACGSALFAQTHRSGGVLSGTIVGPDGARLPGVEVVVVSDDVEVGRVVSSDLGTYRVSGLEAGRHSVRASLPGFSPASASVDIADGRDTILELRLTVATMTEVVTVVGSSSRENLETPRIRESSARDVGEALSALAGVWKVRRGPIANDVVLRGFQGENLTVLIDGTRLYGACPNNMDPAAFHVDFAEVERVEIGKGPFDLKNQGGLGGTVNIITKRAPDGIRFTPQMAAGSHGYLNPTLTGSYGSDRVAVLAGYSHRAGDPYTDGAGRSFLQAANYRDTAFTERAFTASTAWARADVSPSDGHGIKVSYSRQRAGTVLYPYLMMDADYDNADRATAEYGLKLAHDTFSALRAQGYYTRVKHWMTDERRMSSVGFARPYSMATMADTQTAGGKVEAVIRGGVVGVEMFQRGWSAETLMAGMKYMPQYSIPDVRLTAAGVYGEYILRLGEPLRVDLGGRLDQTSIRADSTKANTALYQAFHGGVVTSATNTYPSGKVRLSYQPAAALTLSGGIGRTVRVPDPQERYMALRRAGSDWVGNPFLRPTANTGIEASAAFRAGRLSLTGTIHRAGLHDYINVYQQLRVEAVPGVPNTLARSYRNVEATMSGLEVAGVYSVTDRLFVSADVSAVRGRQRIDPAAGVNSPYLAETPPPRGRLVVRYEARNRTTGWFGEVESVYSMAQTAVDTDLRESPTPPYALTNVRAGATLWRLRAAFGVANLFNRSYYEALSYQRDPFRNGARVYEPGRTFYVNVTLALGETR